MYTMPKMVSVQKKDQAFKWNDSFMVKHFVAEFKGARYSSRIREGATVRIFQGSMNGPALAVIKE